MFNEQTVRPIKNGLNRPHVVSVYSKFIPKDLQVIQLLHECSGSRAVSDCINCSTLIVWNGQVIGSLEFSKFRPLAWGPVKLWWHPGIWKICWIVFLSYSLSLSRSLCRVQSVWQSAWWVRVRWKECPTKLAIQRRACLLCTCWLANLPPVTPYLVTCELFAISSQRAWWCTVPEDVKARQDIVISNWTTQWSKQYSVPAVKAEMLLFFSSYCL